MVCQNAPIRIGIDTGYFQVPVIALFTKYDQFKRNIKMKLEDENHSHAEAHVNVEVERIFEQHYLAPLSRRPPFIHMESEEFVTGELIIC